MEWLLMLIGLIYIIGITRWFPGLLRPRCPLCGASLECREIIGTAVRWRGWGIHWLRFSCSMCLYAHSRPQFGPMYQ